MTSRLTQSSSDTFFIATLAPGAAIAAATTGAYANQGSVGRLDTHGNYIGFKGTEDLGNGLKALFVFETAMATDTNSPTGTVFGGRDAYVGLTGGFGTVVAGTLTHPLRAMGAKVELLAFFYWWVSNDNSSNRFVVTGA